MSERTITLTLKAPFRGVRSIEISPKPSGVHLTHIALSRVATDSSIETLEDSTRVNLFSETTLVTNDLMLDRETVERAMRLRGLLQKLKPDHEIVADYRLPTPQTELVAPIENHPQIL